MMKEKEVRKELVNLFYAWLNYFQAEYQVVLTSDEEIDNFFDAASDLHERLIKNGVRYSRVSAVLKQARAAI